MMRRHLDTVKSETKIEAKTEVVVVVDVVL
jgi:hypothetical protein